MTKSGAPGRSHDGDPAASRAELWEIATGQEPIAATAIHDGHELRVDVAELMALSDLERLREEDPFTGAWARIASTRLIPRRSRFEIDLNRPRHRAVYRSPADAWGLRVWRELPPDSLIERSLWEYDAFYAEAFRIFSELERRHGRFVVLDLHAYNHRRAGPNAPADDPRKNPDVNLGTAKLDRQRWGPLIDRFIRDLRGADPFGRELDVRENLRFRGGHLAGWIQRHFPASGCCLAIEIKKFFMNEWTGQPNPAEIQVVTRTLQATLPGLLESLNLDPRGDVG
ncbi:MAG: N-formylglutamate amidohydrolase [Myxococcota bacterium]